MAYLEAVFFDCDGVTVDSDGLQQQAEQETAVTFAEEHDLEFDAEAHDWATMQGWGRTKIAASIYGIPEDSELADSFRTTVAQHTVNIASPDNLSLVPGVTDFVNYLR